MLTTDRSNVLERQEEIDQSPPAPPRVPWGFNWLSWVVALAVLGTAAVLLVLDLNRGDELVAPALSEISRYENPEVFGPGASAGFEVGVVGPVLSEISRYENPEVFGPGASAGFEVGVVGPVLSEISRYENPEVFGLGGLALPDLWTTSR